MNPTNGTDSPIPTLHVNTEPTWRGGEQQTLYLVEGLARRGHPVVLCAQRDSEMVKRARAVGIETEALRMRGEVDPVAVWKLAAAIRRHRPALVHCHTSHAHTLAALAARLLGRRRPRLLLTRRVDFSIYRHSFLGLNGIKYRMVDRIVAISSAVRRVLLDDGIPEDRIRIVPSGIDPARFATAQPIDLRREFSLPEDTVIVVNVAYFADHKGQRFLVEAAPEVLARFPSVAMVLVGDGECRPELMELARELRVDERVLFPGFRTDVPGILRGADICVMPSRLEGLGTSVLDALICGLPVVATQTGGIPEMVQDGVNGILVEPNDSEGIAKALLRLLQDPAERKRLGAAGPRTVHEKYTADQMVEGNLEVYRSLTVR